MTLVDSAFNLGPSKYESKLQNANLTAEKSFSSVVIPTYNRSKSLIRTLKAIYNQNLLPHEVIVVDDHSSDETTEICLKILSKKLPFSLIYLRQKYNLGPAAARNMGVMNAKNDLILFTDDDCEPDPSWVFELTKKATQSPEYAGVGGPVLSAKKDKIGLFFDYHRMLDPKFIDSHPIYLVTANAAYRRDWILKVGGLTKG